MAATTTEQASPDSPTDPSAGESTAVLSTGAPDWLTVAEPTSQGASEAPLSLRTFLLRLGAGILVVLIVVTVGGTIAARRLAEREAVNGAAQQADLLAETVVQPALTDELLEQDPAALQAFDQVVRDQVLGDAVVHVKLWTPQGLVLYADEPDLMGREFALEEEQQEALSDPRTVAEISSLDDAENELDTSKGGKLVEVYRPVWTPNGGTMLFEIYAPYDQVSQRTGQLWRGFAGVTLSSLLLFLVLLAPLIWRLTSRVRREQRERELLLERSVEASSAERRMIAATLHDGPVQDLAATSFVVSAAAARAGAAGQHALERELGEVSASVRTSIRSLRTLLVDIYPPSLAQAGLAGALTDLAQSVRAPGLAVRIAQDPDADLGLTQEQERLVYRIAQETLRNAAQHAVPCTVTITLLREDEAVVLDVADDGPGFDVAARLAEPEDGHLGLRLLADLAASGGARLSVNSAAGHGTRWRLLVPEPGDEDR